MFTLVKHTNMWKCVHKWAKQTVSITMTEQQANIKVKLNIGLVRLHSPVNCAVFIFFLNSSVPQQQQQQQQQQ